jgi:hypothetical protein
MFEKESWEVSPLTTALVRTKIQPLVGRTLTSSSGKSGKQEFSLFNSLLQRKEAKRGRLRRKRLTGA